MSGFTSAFQGRLEPLVGFCRHPTPEVVDATLFSTGHFPYFFVFEVIWICLIIRRFAPQFEWHKSYLVAGFMSLFGRALAAFVIQRNPPLLEEPLYVPIFSVLWFLMNCSPYDLVHRVLSLAPVVIVLQLAYTVVQVREIVHGVDIGFSQFGTGVGAILFSAMLSSTASFVWLLFADGTREFSNQMILRNLLVSWLYLQLVHKGVAQYMPFAIDRMSARLCAWGAYVVLAAIDNVLFGLRGRKGADITLLTYIGKLLTFCGDK